MANPEHLNILNQGVDVWNNWRKENRSIPSHPDYLHEIDLTGADFAEANLSGFNLEENDLSCANLLMANLSKANLSKATLIDTNLLGTNFQMANLSEANLTDCHFYAANLSGANLNKASMGGTILNKTDLNNTDFTNAYIGGMIFSDVDLSKAKNIESCIHDEASSIDHQTIMKSGKLPIQFLRGIGLPDQIINYYNSFLLENIIQYYSCFISYSHKNEAFAKRLYLDLQNNGIRCWFAPEDMKIGDKIRGKIDEAIRFRDKLLLILSSDSIESGWVEKEVETAFEEENKRKDIILFPVQIDDKVMDTNEAWASDIRRTRHIGDFREWKNHDKYKEALNRLIRDLQKEKNKPNT